MASEPHKVVYEEQSQCFGVTITKPQFYHYVKLLGENSKDVC